MPGLAEKISLFKQSINKMANIQLEQLDEEISSYKSMALSDIEQSALSDSYKFIQKEMSAIESQAAIALSRSTMELKRELLKKREFYTQAIFGEVLKIITLFTESAEYPEFLKNKAARFLRDYPYSGSCLFLREADMKYKPEIQKVIPPDLSCEILASSDIILGGVIYENRQRGYFGDESLDEAINQQRKWFRENSGFSIELKV